MHYHQDSKLKSNKKKSTNNSRRQVEQIVVDKEITQQWKIDTNDPTELLAFSLKHLYLSRICQFWHQLKFLYFQNYQQSIKYKKQNKFIQQSSDVQQQESSVEIIHSTQRLEQCKNFTKKIWKITRQRLLRGFNKIKQQSGVQDEQSLQLQDQKLNSYMRFLKLQQNKRIDLAIQIFDSVVQKNTRRKFLNAFLNMRQNLKTIRKHQVYKNRINIECFIEIIMRNIRKLNSELISQCFAQVYELSQGIKNEQMYERQQRQIKEAQQRVKRLKQSQVNEERRNQSHFRSLSNRKVIINEDEDEMIKKKDTINKYQSRSSKVSKQLRQNSNHISTIKRQNERQVLHKSNINSMRSQYNSNNKSNNEHIINSHYYYDDYEEEQNQNNDLQDVQQDKEYHQHKNKKVNMNSIPTTRGIHTRNYQHSHIQRNQYLINGVQNNIISQTFNKKTARTPSRSDVNKKSYLSQQIQLETQNHKITNSQHAHGQLHIPITQRIQKNHREQYYQQEDQEQISQDQNESGEKIHQQICVIRNFSTTPSRKPDRYEKIPIMSSNIEFKQFFLNSGQKRVKRTQNVHSSSYYEKKSCQDCNYCLRLKRVKQVVQQISNKKLINLNQNIIYQTKINKSYNEQIHHSQVIKENNIDQNKNNYEIDNHFKYIKQNKTNSLQINIDQINQQSNNIPHQSITIVKQKQTILKNKIQRKQSPHHSQSHNHSPNQQSNQFTNQSGNNLVINSPQYKNINKLGTTSQVSSFNQQKKSKTLSQRKIFTRKPMH